MEGISAAAVFLGGGVLGLLGSSVLFPLVAWPAYFFRRGPRAPSRRPVGGVAPDSLEIIVPAHDEAALIGRTLKSIRRSVRYLRERRNGRPPPRVSILVAADGCADSTAAEARRSGVRRVSRTARARGKWSTMTRLCRRSRADWVILADAGSLWPEALLAKIIRQIGADGDVIAAAPSYLPRNPGRLHRVLWRFEAGLKRLEARSGGPVSLHGATVCYKTVVLKRALRALGGRRWLNDDVVIPMAMRSLCPDGVIRYPVGRVLDAGARVTGLDLGRRLRLLLGNRQWIRALLPFCFRRNWIAGLVSLRRLFRVLWAYWLGFIALGLAIALEAPLLPAAAVFAVLVLVSGAFRQLAGAALVSLLAPLECLVPESWLRVIWE